MAAMTRVYHPTLPTWLDVEGDVEPWLAAGWLLAAEGEREADEVEADADVPVDSADD